jgi:hypothetical protein
MRRAMVRFHSRTYVMPLILLPSIFAGCCVNGGSEGSAELASRPSGDPL